MDDRSDPAHHSLVQSTVDAFVDGTRAVAELMGSMGSGALGVLPEPVPATIARLLASMRQLADQMPAVTAELDVIVEELHAKRLSIQALQAELGALDSQLEVLERSLEPVQAWSRQWNRMRHALTETLRTTGGAREGG